jgi:hypothetical protein
MVGEPSGDDSAAVVARADGKAYSQLRSDCPELNANPKVAFADVTAMYYPAPAAKREHMRWCIELALRAGADIHIRRAGGGLTAFGEAALNNDAELMQLYRRLRPQLNINLLSYDMTAPTLVATATLGYADATRLLVQWTATRRALHKNRDGSSADIDALNFAMAGWRAFEDMTPRNGRDFAGTVRELIDGVNWDDGYLAEAALIIAYSPKKTDVWTQPRQVDTQANIATHQRMIDIFLGAGYKLQGLADNLKALGEAAAKRPGYSALAQLAESLRSYAAARGLN